MPPESPTPAHQPDPLAALVKINKVLEPFAGNTRRRILNALRILDGEPVLLSPEELREYIKQSGTTV